MISVEMRTISFLCEVSHNSKRQWTMAKRKQYIYECISTERGYEQHLVKMKPYQVAHISTKDKMTLVEEAVVY